MTGLIVLVLSLLALAMGPTTKWVGSTDLEVEFSVADAASGVPIPGAEVQIRSEGGFYEEREPRDFQLVAGPDGRASHLCRDSMCFGSKDLFTDSFHVHLPFWRFQAIAPGYEQSEIGFVDVPEYERQVQRVGPGRTKLSIPISLRRSGG